MPVPPRVAPAADCDRPGRRMLVARRSESVPAVTDRGPGVCVRRRERRDPAASLCQRARAAMRPENVIAFDPIEHECAVVDDVAEHAAGRATVARLQRSGGQSSSRPYRYWRRSASASPRRPDVSGRRPSSPEQPWTEAVGVERPAGRGDRDSAGRRPVETAPSRSVPPFRISAAGCGAQIRIAAQSTACRR